MPFFQPIQPPFRACLADQLWFILESGPYFRQARLNGERSEFLAMYEEIWFSMWPVFKVSEDDIYVECRKGQVRDRIEHDLDFSADMPNVQSFDGTWKEFLVEKQAIFDADCDIIPIPVKKPKPAKDTSSEVDTADADPTGKSQVPKDAKAAVNADSVIKPNDVNTETDTKKTEDDSNDDMAKTQGESLSTTDSAGEDRKKINILNERRKVKNRNSTVIPKFLEKVRKAAGPLPEYIVLDDDSDNDTKIPVPKKRKVSSADSSKPLSSVASTSLSKTIN